MATRIKSKTMAAVPQSKNDCAESIRLLGDLQRQFERQRSEMNDHIAAIAQAHQPLLSELSDRIQALQGGIQAWCEAHRAELCGEGDKLGKTANLVTGEVSWRQRPPSVRVTGEESVIDLLKRMTLGRFVRAREAVNKEAILLEPEAVAGVPGIKIVTGVEDFVITPFEVETEGV